MELEGKNSLLNFWFDGKNIYINEDFEYIYKIFRGYKIVVWVGIDF